MKLNPTKFNKSMIDSFLGKLTTNLNSSLTEDDENINESLWQDFNQLIEWSVDGTQQHMFTDDFFEHPEYNRLVKMNKDELLNRRSFQASYSQINEMGAISTNLNDQTFSPMSLSRNAANDPIHDDFEYRSSDASSESKRFEFIAQTLGADQMDLEQSQRFFNSIVRDSLKKGVPINEHTLNNTIRRIKNGGLDLAGLGWVLVENPYESKSSPYDGPIDSVLKSMGDTFDRIHPFGNTGFRLREDPFAAYVASKIAGSNTVEGERIAADFYFDALIQAGLDTVARVSSLSSSDYLREYRDNVNPNTVRSLGNDVFALKVRGQELLISPVYKDAEVQIGPDDKDKEEWWQEGVRLTHEQWRESVKEHPDSSLGAVPFKDLDMHGSFSGLMGSTYDLVFNMERSVKEHFSDPNVTEYDVAASVLMTNNASYAALLADPVDIVGEDVLITRSGSEWNLPMDALREKLVASQAKASEDVVDDLNIPSYARQISAYDINVVENMLDDRSVVAYMQNPDIRARLAETGMGRQLISAWESWGDKVKGRSSGSVVIDASNVLLEAWVDNAAFELNVNNPDAFHDLFGKEAVAIPVSKLLSGVRGIYDKVIEERQSDIERRVTEAFMESETQPKSSERVHLGYAPLAASPTGGIAALGYLKGLNINKRESARGQAFNSLVMKGMSETESGNLDSRWRVTFPQWGDNGIWNNAIEEFMHQRGKLDIFIPQGFNADNMADFADQVVERFSGGITVDRRGGTPGVKGHLTDIYLDAHSKSNNRKILFDVKGVKDADTAVVFHESIGDGNQLTLRLHSVDAPEIFKNKGSEEFRFGQLGKRVIHHLVNSDKYQVLATVGVTDQFGNEITQDSFHRYVGRLYVYDENGQYIGLAEEILVRSGLARYVQKFNAGMPRMQQQLMGLQRQARDEGLGVHSIGRNY